MAEPSTAVAVRPAPARHLYLLKVSAWSQRVLMTLKHARVPVHVHEFLPFLTAYVLRVRQGCPWGVRVTAPAFFRAGQGWTMDSEAIARKLDADRASDVPTLFPPEHDEALRRIVVLTDNVMYFWRGQLVQAMRNTPCLAAALFAPKSLRNMPFVETISSFAVNLFAAKYKPETDACSESAARAALEELTVAVNAGQEVDKVKYLLAGRLTFVDFVVALGANLDKSEAFFAKKSSLPSPFTGEFPELRDYAKRMLGRHAAAEDIPFPPPRYDVCGNEVS